jgi:hypothetical protein
MHVPHAYVYTYIYTYIYTYVTKKKKPGRGREGGWGGDEELLIQLVPRAKCLKEKKKKSKKKKKEKDFDTALPTN